MSNYEIIAAGLEFPEGPVVMPDGSIVLVEIKRGTITRVDPDDGSVDVLAQPGGRAKRCGDRPGRCAICVQ